MDHYDYDYDTMLARLRQDFEEGEKTLQVLGLKEERVLDDVKNSSREMLKQAQSRNSQLERELDAIKAAYLKTSDLQSLQEPELVAIMSKFGGQDVGLLHEDIKSLQAEIHGVEQQITQKRKALARAEQVASETRRSVETDLVPLEQLQVQLQTREEKLRAQIQAEGKQDDVIEFFSAQSELIKRQETLEQELHDKEQLLLALRQDICSLDVNGSNFSASERENARLYVQWKEALQAKIEQYLTFRQKQYELLMHINGRRETLHIITDLLTTAKVSEVQQQEQRLQEQLQTTTKRVAQLEDGLAKTQEAIDGFRVEFEQMRAAILVDKAAKSTAVGELRRQRDQMRRADDYFSGLFNEEKSKVLAEMDAKWKRRLAAIQKEGTAELRREQKALAQKMGLVKAALKKRFEAGLQPILDKVRGAYEEEAAKHSRLQQQIEVRERAVEDVIEETHELQRCIADVEAPHSDEAAAVRERDALLSQLQELWHDTQANPDDIASFLSDLDLMAPFNEAVLDFYERNGQQLLS